ncbi:MAG TPA: winged helix-turn-helix domain-containing protein [Terriglobales bacterium]|nr:winged helix-turn-helix domain-containing protein [Terriglobales bacterium]
MASPTKTMSSDRFRFHDFELNLQAYELRRGGSVVKLERIPMELLRLLVERPGQLVTRDEIIAHIWGKEVFLDTNNSINTAVRKLRRTLGDNTSSPTMIQTAPGKGYRFAAAVERVDILENAVRKKGEKALMLAVLPFENLSGEREQEYFSDGMTEETIASLGQLSPNRMGVIARTSSMAYKHSKKTVGEIGKELAVDYILEGSVRREREKVRITAQLIRVSDQIHLWAQSYDRELGSVLGVQAELAMAIAEQVQLRLKPGANTEAPREQKQDPEAYDAYLRGRYHWARRKLPEVQKAIRFFEQAISISPAYAEAYAGVADSYLVLPITSDMPAKSCFPKAKTAALKALELNPRLAEAHTSLGAIRFWLEWDWAGAIQAFDHALELNPNYSIARLFRAHCFSNWGKHSEALREIQRACRLDPLAPILSTLYAEFLYHAGHYPESIEQSMRAIDLDADFWVSHLNLARAYEQVGDYGRAINEIEKARALSSGNSEPIGLLGYVLARSGKRKASQERLQELLQLSKSRYVPPFNVALSYWGLGETDKALEFLQKGCEERDVHMTFLLDPKWDALRTNPRFISILEVVGLGENAKKR